MAIDIMGNSFGGYDIENDTDEELMRRRRQHQLQQQQAQANPVKQTITTDPTTGEQTMKIEGSVQDLSAANPYTPTVVSPVAPKPLNDADITRQRESGGNYGIGYHNPEKSTAYGAYGLTAPAYKDVQAANPAFANRPITSLNPQEQDQAYNTFRDVQGRQLQQFGLAPTPENLRLSHLLGAKGAADYINGNQISPQAAAANGGEAQLRAEAQRRYGQPGVQMASSGSVMSDVAPTPNEIAVGQLRQQGQLPPSGPVAPVAPQQPGAQGPAVAAPVNPNQPPAAPAPQPNLTQMAPGAPEQAGPPTSAMTQQGWAERLNTAKQDDKMLSNLAYDPNTPQFVRETAADTLYQRLDAANKENRAKQAYIDAAKNGNLDRVLRDANRKTDEGSWLKFLLYGFIDPNMAKQERLKLFPEEGAKWIDFNTSDGKQQGIIQMAQDGKPLKAKLSDGTIITDEKQLIQYSQGVGKGEHFETGLVDNATGVGGYTRSVVNGRPIVRDSTNRVVTDPTILNNLRKVGVEGTQAERIEADKVKKGYAALGKDIPNPTADQTYQYLKRAGVSDTRIEQEMGLAPGTLTKQGGRVTVSAPTETAPMGNAPTGKAKPTVAIDNPKGFNINRPPEPEPGERTDSHQARVNDWQKWKDRKEKLREDLPKIEGQAQESIALVDELLNHPGFENVIGVTWNPAAMLNLPTTDARAFRSKYEQLKGEQFLSAYNQLRGGGAISDSEGKAAKAAVAALQDPYISEAEFKRNAQIYIDTIKRGVNRQKASVGEPPAYPDVPTAAESHSSGSNSPIRKKADEIIGQ